MAQLVCVQMAVFLSGVAVPSGAHKTRTRALDIHADQTRAGIGVLKSKNCCMRSAGKWAKGVEHWVPTCTLSACK